MKFTLSAIALACSLAALTAPASAQTLSEVEDESVMIPSLNLSVDAVEDMDVVDANGTEIGEVDDVLMEGGEITSIAVEIDGSGVIVDKSVVMPIANLSVSGENLVTNMTKDQIDALPEWDH